MLEFTQSLRPSYTYRKWGRFTGLNIRGFSAIEVFAEILLRCLGHKCSLFSTIKERCLYSQKNFLSTPENREKRESLAKQIFHHLRYIKIMAVASSPKPLYTYTVLI